MSINQLSADVEFAVEFYDVDSMDIVWHGNYIKYFEKARCALLDKIGYGYRQMKESGFAFPVTGITVKYIGPLKFAEKVRARAILDEYENCLKIKYEIANAETGMICTKGSSTQMAYDIAAASSCFVCPPAFIEKVEALLREEGSPADTGEGNRL
ncbi:thioesterase [Spirochaetia bacterium]|nr:thioesterase [Spirochaetia bacterium]